MKQLLIIIGVVIFMGCTNENKQLVLSDDSNHQKNSLINDTITISNISNDSIKTIIGNAIGLIVANVGDNVDTDLELFNEDKSLWKSFSFTDNKKVFEKIKPYAFHSDYFLLSFRCVERNANWYKVIVNEETNEAKYIEAKDVNFKFQTWETYILNLFSVTFNFNKNPIKEDPSISSRKKEYDANEFYHPIQIKEDWLQVEWSEGNLGWIKWKEKNKLLIEFNYLS